ncbi:MAG: PCMD domain-containing protein [Bacteroidales bacterium]|nr:PCMD domain-containing protein [Bacteroidales bacterium]
MLMRYITKLFLLASVMLLAASCMKDEPLNAECDIEQVILHTPHVGEVFFNPTDSAKNVLYSASDVVFNVRRHAPLEGVTLSFTITEGATIERITPGTDFTPDEAVEYRVTSQDGQWHRVYKITISPEPVHIVSSELKYDFENFELEPKLKKYYIWHNEQLDGTFGNDWATGNPGFKLSMPSAAPDKYPTVPVDGIDGKALKLTTSDTGPFGAMANKRLAAGNFFLGEFDVSQALGDAMAATRFGIPFALEPVKFTGYYQYKPGTKFQDKNGKEVVGRIDEGSIYAVFYRNHDAEGNPVRLRGDNVLTSPLIVALAKVKDVFDTGGEWKEFSVQFDYREPLDRELLANKGYNLAVVFSSSEAGATFEGAIGSTLLVDKVRLHCQKEE